VQNPIGFSAEGLQKAADFARHVLAQLDHMSTPFMQLPPGCYENTYETPRDGNYQDMHAVNVARIAAFDAFHDTVCREVQHSRASVQRLNAFMDQLDLLSKTIRIWHCWKDAPLLSSPAAPSERPPVQQPAIAVDGVT
jgi:hypothetical protein